MLNLFKESNFSLKRVSIFLLLINLIYCQEISSNIDIKFSSSKSKNWWDIYNNEGLKPSEIKLEYSFNHLHRNIESSFSLFHIEKLNDHIQYRYGGYYYLQVHKLYLKYKDHRLFPIYHLIVLMDFF